MIQTNTKGLQKLLRPPLPGVSPQTPRRKKKNQLAKLKGGKGGKPKLLQKFKLAAQKVNKAQEYIEKTR